MFFERNINDIHNSVAFSVTECGEVLIRMEESLSTNSEIIVNMDGAQYILDENNDFKMFPEHLNGDTHSLSLVTDTASLSPCSLENEFKSLYFQENNICDFYQDVLTMEYSYTYAKNHEDSKLKMKVSKISQKYRIIDRLKSSKEMIVKENNSTMQVKEKIQETFFQLCFEADKELTIENQSSLACPICKRVFSTNSNAEKHIFYCHTAPRPYQCKCKKSFVEASKLQWHIRHYKNSDLHGIMNNN